MRIILFLTVLIISLYSYAGMCDSKEDALTKMPKLRPMTVMLDKKLMVQEIMKSINHEDHNFFGEIRVKIATGDYTIHTQNEEKIYDRDGKYLGLLTVQPSGLNNDLGKKVVFCFYLDKDIDEEYITEKEIKEIVKYLPDSVDVIYSAMVDRAGNNVSIFNYPPIEQRRIDNNNRTIFPMNNDGKNQNTKSNDSPNGSVLIL